MSAFYNEIDPFAAAWLRELIKAGHIADGVVDERSIEDITPKELHGFSQCHFFAGIGVWSYALRNAGWPDDRPVWTGSCPCQPFSAAGKGSGFDDERHLWPAFHHLIKECKPASVLGEQVASKDAGPWIDLVHTDMEALGYAFGAVPFPSAGVGAPHIRDRLYWVANTDKHGRGAVPRSGILNPKHNFEPCSSSGGLGDDILQQRPDGQPRVGDEHDQGGRVKGAATIAGLRGDLHAGPTNGLWADADWLFCRDGKWRPVEPGLEPLVNGAPARVGRLRGYGNAINAIQAQIFIEATGLIA